MSCTIVLVLLSYFWRLTLTLVSRQERLVQSYVDDANARRQFEDAASLQTSLDELRSEIERLRLQA